MDETDEFGEPKAAPAAAMPKQVLIAVVALWASAALMVLATVSSWLALNAEGVLGDYLYQYPVQTGSGPFLALFAALAAAGVRGHTNQGRITGIVVGFCGAAVALNNMAVGIEYTVALVAYIAMLPMLFSADAKRWCPK
jgi:hypothetical protein